MQLALAPGQNRLPCFCIAIFWTFAVMKYLTRISSSMHFKILNSIEFIQVDCFTWFNSSNTVTSLNPIVYYFIRIKHFIIRILTYPFRVFRLELCESSQIVEWSSAFHHSNWLGWLSWMKPQTQLTWWCWFKSFIESIMSAANHFFDRYIRSTEFIIITFHYFISLPRENWYFYQIYFDWLAQRTCLFLLCLFSSLCRMTWRRKREIKGRKKGKERKKEGKNREREREKESTIHHNINNIREGF